MGKEVGSVESEFKGFTGEECRLETWVSMIKTERKDYDYDYE